jgi:hypothetical protein
MAIDFVDLSSHALSRTSYIETFRYTLACTSPVNAELVIIVTSFSTMIERPDFSCSCITQLVFSTLNSFYLVLVHPTCAEVFQMNRPQLIQ